MWDCKVVDHALHHNDAGGFGPGGAGLPVVPGGAGYGYPLGTGMCSDELTTCRLFCSSAGDTFNFQTFLQEWDQAASHLLKQKLPNMVVYHIFTLNRTQP